MDEKTALTGELEAALTVRGSSAQQAAARLAETGQNVIPERRKPGPLLIFLYQFKSPFIYILISTGAAEITLVILSILFGMPGAQAIHIGAMYTPDLSDVLQIQPVSLVQWAQLPGIALSLIAVDELHKLWHNRNRKCAHQ